MLLGLTTEGKLGLGILAGLFIVFAALSAFYFPRRNPDFPGNRLGLFTLVTVLLFVGTMAGVVIFAKEEEHGATQAEHADADPGATTPEEDPTATGTTGGAEAAGDAAAGEAVFTSAGCGACHVLEAAGSGGVVGPNLDESKPDAALVVERVTNGKGAMPSFAEELEEQQIQNVAAYVVESTSG